VQLYANLAFDSFCRCRRVCCRRGARGFVAGCRARGRAFLTAEVGWAYQTTTNGQGLHADDLAVHLDTGGTCRTERGKREAKIITLQVIARGLYTTMANLPKGL
jgi:hypothetical protein